MQKFNFRTHIAPTNQAGKTLFTKWYMMFFAPLLIIAWVVALRNLSGPFWLATNFDPTYQYLLNSLSLSQGLPSGYADHPGATLQWLGAVLLHIINFFTGKDDLVVDVLTRPEFYLSIMHSVLISFLFATLTISGFLTQRWFNDPVAALLMQCGVFISHTARHKLSHMNPEPLLLILAIWLAVAVLYHAYQVQQGSGKEPAWQYGLIAGLGMALKINFAPLVILPLILLNGLRRWCIYIGVSLAVFLALAANPLMNHEKFSHFFKELIARKGYNRPIEPTSSDFQAMIDGFFKLMQSFWQTEKPLMLLILLFVGIGIWVLIVKKKPIKATEESFYKRLWFGLLLVLLAQVFLVSNGPRAHIHYMCPLFGLVGLLAVILWKWPITLLRQESKAKFQYKSFFLLVTLIISIFIAINLSGELRKTVKDTGDWSEAYRFKNDQDLLKEPTIYYYYASDKRYALTFGNNWTKGHFSQKLSSLYPNVYYYSIFNEYLYKDFGMQEITLLDLFSQTETVMIQGVTDRYVRLIDPREIYKLFQADVIFDGSVEKITLLRPNRQLKLFLMNKKN